MITVHPMTRQQIREMEQSHLKMREIINVMADYVENSGFCVRYDIIGGEPVVLIEGADDCFVLEFEARERFMSQVGEYVEAMNGNEEAADLAAAKPYVESLA